MDLGCGLGRHSILFGKNGFRVYCFDISKNAIERTREWAEKENLSFEYRVGDMLELTYLDDSIDAILCLHVISHTDTIGIKKAISEIKRILKKDMEEGPEYKIPHFYADYDLIQELFNEFKIESIQHIGTFREVKGKIFSSYHYHLLIKKL